MPPKTDPESHLPLKPAAFHILLSVSVGERHGYAIMQHVERLTEGAVRLGPGTLYETIARLEDEGLLAEWERRPPPEDDHPQRRYYTLTPLGDRVLREEIRRVGALVDYARLRVLGPVDGEAS